MSWNEEVSTELKTKWFRWTEQLEIVVMDIERHLNNRPLTYVEDELGKDRVLTPNTILWGQNSYTVDEDFEEEKLTQFEKRLQHAREHAWTRWRKEYIYSLMESHKIQKERSELPDLNEVVLVVGDEKNRGGKVIKHIEGKEGPELLEGCRSYTKGTPQSDLCNSCAAHIRSSKSKRTQPVREENVVETKRIPETN